MVQEEDAEMQAESFEMGHHQQGNSFFSQRNGNFASQPIENGHNDAQRAAYGGIDSDGSTSSLSTLSENSELLDYQNYLLKNCINAALPEQPPSHFSSRTLPTSASQRSSAISSEEMVASMTMEEKGNGPRRKKGKSKWFQFS